MTTEPHRALPQTPQEVCFLTPDLQSQSPSNPLGMQRWLWMTAVRILSQSMTHLTQPSSTLLKHGEQSFLNPLFRTIRFRNLSFQRSPPPILYSTFSLLHLFFPSPLFSFTSSLIHLLFPSPLLSFTSSLLFQVPKQGLPCPASYDQWS